jgi:stage II sporulation protein D
VVKSEGGSGKHVEFYKTQAVIARTYMYKYFYKHSSDRYNLCDNTHCQVFNGLTVDSVITRAARETRGLVIIGPDSSLVISAFHSNCGGETSPAEYVWLSPRPYLKRVVDQYCISSRNAAWQKTIPLQEWKEYLVKKGLHCNPDEIIVRNSECLSRVLYYHHDSLEIPMSQVRNDLGLRSAFFSLTVVGNQVVIKGRGYGHGVGLCQEGAMVMAARGHDFRQIIGFYYPNTRVTGIDNVTDLPEAFLNGEK